MNNIPGDVSRPKLWLGRLSHFVFWSWNFSFILVSAFGVLPILATAPADVWERAASVELLARCALLLLLPAASTLAGFIWLRGQPSKLLQLFYGIEVPLTLFMLMRTFALDRYSQGSAHLAACTAIALLGLVAHLFVGHAKRLLLLQVMARTVGIVLVLWAGLLLLSIAAEVAPEIVRTSLPPFGALAALAVLSPFLLYTATLVIAAPVGFLVAHTVGYARLLRHSRLRGQPTGWLVATTVLVTLASAVAANKQSRITETTTDRDTMLNAYLAPDLYLAPVAQASPLRRVLAAPFLYAGDSFWEDQQLARTRYESTFDTPLEKGERKLLAATRAHERLWSRDRSTSVLDIDARRVRLQKQEVSLHETGDFAEVEIHDTYENQTANDEEIFYYFTLPEDAAVTGLWLGADDNRAERWAGVVAPRGAAQRVYRAEVQRRVDPALVEQLGPVQYRLRAFPIPARGRLHLWMSYTAARQGAEWPRPHVLEKRNIYWDETTQYLRYGEAVTTAQSDEWVPNLIPATARLSREPQRAVLPDGTSVERQPIDARAAQRPEGKRILLIVDESYSMREQRDWLSANLAWARTHLASHNEVFVARRAGLVALKSEETTGEVTPDDAIGSAPFEAKGHDTLASLLVRADTHFDVWMVLTDATGVEGDIGGVLPPLWVISADPPQQFSDSVQKAIARRGSGLSTSVEKTASRMATMLADPSVITATDTSIWRKGPRAVATEVTPLTRVAVKHTVATAADLQAAHKLAIAARVVTPLSSIIVLVDERQRQALKQASDEADAFSRENETGLPQANFAVTATPEPETWALIILALALVLLSTQRTKATGRLS